MWLARNKDNSLYLYMNKPKRNVDNGIWESEIKLNHYKLSGTYSWIFKNIKWEDKEPTEIGLKIIK